MINRKQMDIFHCSTTPTLVLLSIGLLLGQLGCAATKVELPPLHNPSYLYEPTNGQGGEAVSIALLVPNFEDVETVSELDQAFQGALQRALLAYFTAHGFAVSGPFDSMDAMTFPEKKQADLVLQIVLAYDGNFPQIQRESFTEPMFGTTSYTYWANGTASLSGAISFTLWEPLSQQRMWTKEVPVPVGGVDCTVEKTKNADLVNVTWHNAGAKLLEALFIETMRQSERYFHPDEVRLVKEQSLEIRENKVY